MGANTAKDESITRAMKGYAVGHRNAGFPNVLEALHFFDAEGGMQGILHQSQEGLFRARLNLFGETSEVPRKRFRPCDPLGCWRRGFTSGLPAMSRGLAAPQLLKSLKRSSTDSNSFSLPAAISASASLSFFCHSGVQNQTWSRGTRLAGINSTRRPTRRMSR